MPHDESSITLTLPGDLSGWLRKCSPVRVARALEIQGVIVAAPIRDQSLVLWVDSMLSPLQAKWERNHKVSLDLGDATGRGHAALWLAEQRHCTDVVTATLIPGHRLIGHPEPVWGLSTTSWRDGERWSAVEEPSAIYDLDPSDPRLLPDGSRWVDAEALRLVCLHVAAS